MTAELVQKKLTSKEEKFQGREEWNSDIME
jgi:hypothetical protein